MGCFSYLCQECGKGIKSSSFDGEDCIMYLLQGGKVMDKMEGDYNSYGACFRPSGELDPDNPHGLKLSQLWEWQISTPATVSESGYERTSEREGWSRMCNLMFNDNAGDGIAAVHKCCDTGNIPTITSLSDPNQGWGDYDPDAEEDDEEECYLGNVSDDNSYPTEYKMLAGTWKERQTMLEMSFYHEKALDADWHWENNEREKKLWAEWREKVDAIGYPDVDEEELNKITDEVFKGQD